MQDDYISDYRGIIMTATRFPKRSVPEGEDINVYLYDHLNKTWNENLPIYHIESLSQTLKPTKQQISDAELVLFTAAAGLSTFGRKDVLFFLLFDTSNVGRIVRLRLILNKILPLPDELTDLTKSIEILEWLKEHYNELQWDESKLCFFLSSENPSKVL